MPKSDTWPGGVSMETVISKDSTGSCDSVISMNSNFSDDSLDGFAPEVRDSLMFLDETIVSLELEEDSGVSNDELEPHTPTPHTSHTTLPDNKVTINLLAHTRQDDVSKYHEDPNQVMGKDHKPSMSYMVPTPLVLANGSTERILLRSRPSFSAADHKPKSTPQPPTTDVGIPKHTSDTLGTTASQNSGDPEGATRDKLITVPAAVPASGPVAAANQAKVSTSKVPCDAPELTPAKLITDVLEPPTDKPVGPSELISDKHAADQAKMDADGVKTNNPVKLMPTSLADSPGTDQVPTELQAPEASKAVSTGSSDCSSTVSISEDATSATPVGDATTTPQAPAAGPVEAGMEFIPPPMDFMDEPTEDQETPVHSGVDLADIPAPNVPEKAVSETSFPASDIPAPDIPTQNVPQTTFPASDITSPDIPVQEIPDTTFPASEIPAPDVSSQDVSDAAFPASDIPAPVVLSSDVPTQDAPVVTFPVSDIPGPVVSSPHVSPQVLPDAVIPPPEIPAQDNPAHDIPTPVIPTPVIPAPVIPATDAASSKGDPKSAVVPPSELHPKENEAASVPPANQRGPLSYSELEKLRKKASLKKAPGTAPVVQIHGPAAPSQSSPTTEGLPGPPQEYCDPKSPPAVAPKPKKLPPNIIVKPHRSAESVAGPLLSGNRVRTDMDKKKVHMEALLKLGLIKSDESNAAPCSGPSLSPRSRRSWAPPSGPLASPGASSSGPPTPEPPAPLARRATAPKTHQLPAADRHSPKVSPAPNRKMVEVRLAPRQVPSDEVDAVSLRSNEDELEVPDHLPPSPPGTHADMPTPHSFDNSSAPRSHGISVEISPLSSKEDRREALRKLGLLRD